MVDIEAQIGRHPKPKQHSVQQNVSVVEDSIFDGGRRKSPLVGMSKGLSNLSSDAIQLLELQALFVASEARQAKLTAAFAGGMLVVISTASLVSTILLSFAASEYLMTQYGYSREASHSMVGLFALVVALVGALTAVMYLKKLTKAFEGSARELRRNIAWLKQAFAAND